MNDKANDVVPSVTDFEKELDALSLRYFNKNFQDLCPRRKKTIERIAWTKRNRENRK